MPSSWDIYYVVFLSALLSLGIPAALGGISRLVTPKAQRRLKQPPQKVQAVQKNQTLLGQRINVRFFLAINAALVLITLALMLIPCVATLHSSDRSSILRGLISVVTIAGFAGLGLLYSARKGDMSWLGSFTKDPSGGDR